MLDEFEPIKTANSSWLPKYFSRSRELLTPKPYSAANLELLWEHRLAKSVGQWELQRNYYKGVDRLEVLAVYGSDKIEWLKALGCFTEIIQHRTKVFIPVDNAVEIIDLMLISK